VSELDDIEFAVGQGEMTAAQTFTRMKQLIQSLQKQMEERTISDQQVNAVARAFWRRIEPYKTKYGKELPDPLPVEFSAHMGTALTVLTVLPLTHEDNHG